MNDAHFNLPPDMKLFGYFTQPSGKPAYDPGLGCACIYCRQKLEFPVCTTSFWVPGDDKSYFYRVHRGCSDKMQSEGSESHYEGLIIDSIDL